MLVAASCTSYASKRERKTKIRKSKVKGKARKRGRTDMPYLWRATVYDAGHWRAGTDIVTGSWREVNSVERPNGTGNA